MHEPDPQSPTYGTPISALGPEHCGAFQLRRELTDTLSFLSGINWTVARTVAESTGDIITWPFSTLGFVDENSRALVVVIHSASGFFEEPELSISHDEMPALRPMLRALASHLFVELRLASVMVRVRPDDERLQATLQRLGFTTSGRDDAPEPHARLLFTIDAATALRRAFPRGLAPGKVN